jgi:hypothetical protein
MVSMILAALVMYNKGNWFYDGGILLIYFINGLYFIVNFYRILNSMPKLALVINKLLRKLVKISPIMKSIIIYSKNKFLLYDIFFFRKAIRKVLKQKSVELKNPYKFAKIL